MLIMSFSVVRHSDGVSERKKQRNVNIFLPKSFIYCFFPSTGD